MIYDRHRSGARGECLAMAWLINRNWTVFKCFQSQSMCDLVAVKARGAARADVLLLEVRYVGPNSRRAEGLTQTQLDAGVKLLMIYDDGHVELDPEWSRKYVKKDRSARAKAERAAAECEEVETSC